MYVCICKCMYMYTYTYTHVYVCIHMPGEQAREEAEKKVGHGSKHKHRATNTPPGRHPRKKGKWQKTTNGNSQVRVPRKSTGRKMQACVTKAQDRRSKTQNFSTAENRTFLPPSPPSPPRCFCALYRARSDFRCLASNKRPPHSANRTESRSPSGGAIYPKRDTENPTQPGKAHKKSKR